MENIRQAVERARAYQGSSKLRSAESPNLGAERMDSSAGGVGALGLEEIALDAAWLAANRVISYDGADQRSRPYDMLRTQVLQSMSLKGWRTLGVTSPTSGCGKTLTAVNLAFSIARRPDQSVALVDLDLQKPRLASCLGVQPREGGVLNVLREQTDIKKITCLVRAGNHRIVALPTVAARELSESMSSRMMRTLFQELRKEYQFVVFDLPPLLTSDHVISILPQIDCVLLVVAVGHSKATEVGECIRHLQSNQLLRVVVNKTTDPPSNYYYGY